MKLRFAAGLGALLLCLGGTLCSGQCADTWNSFTAYCANTKGCSGSVTGYQPDIWEYGVAVYCSPVECCGSYIASYRPGGTCIMVELRSPAIQDRLAELAAASDLLVADCGGRYALYAPPAGDPKLAGVPGLPGDRVLR